MRFNERPAVRPLAAARTGGALTVEANLFSRFARVLRATFFFYGDAAGAAPAHSLLCHALLSPIPMLLLLLPIVKFACSHGERWCTACCGGNCFLANA